MTVKNVVEVRHFIHLGVKGDILGFWDMKGECFQGNFFPKNTLLLMIGIK